MATHLTSSILVALCILVISCQAYSWAYKGINGKSTWGRVALLCDTGRSQSPIDLQIVRSYHDGSMGPVGVRQSSGSISNTGQENQSRLKYKSSLGSGMHLFNNGHSVQVNIDDNVVLEGAGLQEKFKVAQLHFHWGQESDRGSEHRRMGKHFAMEMHIVCYDSSNYSSLGEAVGKENSLAVLAVFFRVGKFDNHNFDNIINNLEKVHRADANHKVSIPSFEVASLLPENKDNYYRYHGSLTTPGCQESVVWTVLDMPNYVSEHQLKHFRTVLQHSGDYLSDNYRDVQEQHHRRVIRSFPNEINYIVIEDEDVTVKSPPTGAAGAVTVSTMVTGLCASLVILLH